MQPMTANVVPIAPPTNNTNSRMEFMHNNTHFRLRFSYSPGDRVVTRCSLEYKNRPDDAWENYAFAQVFLKGGAVTRELREQERKASLTKLLRSMVATREFARTAWTAYWNRGKYTAPSKY